MTTLKVGIASYADMKARTIAIASEADTQFARDSAYIRSALEPAARHEDPVKVTSYCFGSLARPDATHQPLPLGFG
jgi:hypothetical protein